MGQITWQAADREPPLFKRKLIRPIAVSLGATCGISLNPGSHVWNEDKPCQ